MIPQDFVTEEGLWLKSYRIDNVNYKTKAGRLWNNLETRTMGRHKDKCYAEAVNGFANFQEFAEWCQHQFGYRKLDESGKPWQLDKDALVPGNKVYAPDFCCFLPGKVNSLLIEQVSSLGLPTGVAYSNNGERFVARCRNVEGKKVHIGTYDTAEDAHTSWYAFKQGVVRQVLQRYDLGPVVTEAMELNWNVH